MKQNKDIPTICKLKTISKRRLFNCTLQLSQEQLQQLVCIAPIPQPPPSQDKQYIRFLQKQISALTYMQLGYGYGNIRKSPDFNKVQIKQTRYTVAVTSVFNRIIRDVQDILLHFRVIPRAMSAFEMQGIYYIMSHFRDKVPQHVDVIFGMLRMRYYRMGQAADQWITLERIKLFYQDVQRLLKERWNADAEEDQGEQAENNLSVCEDVESQSNMPSQNVERSIQSMESIQDVPILQKIKDELFQLYCSYQSIIKARQILTIKYGSEISALTHQQCKQQICSVLVSVLLQISITMKNQRVIDFQWKELNLFDIKVLLNVQNWNIRVRLMEYQLKKGNKTQLAKEIAILINQILQR